MPVPALTPSPVRKAAPRPTARPAANPAPKRPPRRAGKAQTAARKYDQAAAALVARVRTSEKAVKAAIQGTRGEAAKKKLKDALRALEDGRGSIEKTRSRVKSGYAALPKISNWWAKVSLEAAGLYLADAGRRDLAVPVEHIVADLRKLPIPGQPVKR